jgi:hypothetical protein
VRLSCALTVSVAALMRLARGRTRMEEPRKAHLLEALGDALGATLRSILLDKRANSSWTYVTTRAAMLDLFHPCKSPLRRVLNLHPAPILPCHAATMAVCLVLHTQWQPVRHAHPDSHPLLLQLYRLPQPRCLTGRAMLVIMELLQAKHAIPTAPSLARLSLAPCAQAPCQLTLPWGRAHK